MKTPFILASSSTFRQQLLKKIIPQFHCFSPDIDETAHEGESPEQLVSRLATQKAFTAKQHFSHGIVIGSDQVAVHQGEILGKPHNKTNATAQLTRFSNEQVTFLTALTLYNIQSGDTLSCIEPFTVFFRPLSDAQISAYLDAETPYQCAGSFKSEGLGICLFDKLCGDDPNALIGLPLLRLNQLLLQWGIDPLLLQPIEL